MLSIKKDYKHSATMISIITSRITFIGIFMIWGNICLSYFYCYDKTLWPRQFIVGRGYLGLTLPEEIKFISIMAGRIVADRMHGTGEEAECSHPELSSCLWIPEAESAPKETGGFQ